MSSSFSWYNNPSTELLSHRHTRSAIKKHEMIQIYKESERENSILKNKLSILRLVSKHNNGKAKSIQTSLRKVNKIRENYKQDKAEIQQILRRNQEKEEEKLDQIKIKRQQSKGYLPYIKHCIEKQKSQEYLTVKKKSLDIDEKLKIYKKSIIKDRQSKAHKIKEEQQMLALNRTQFFQMKQSQVRKSEDRETQRIQRKMRKSRMQFEKMKSMEDSLLEKLDKSREKLNKSMVKMSVTIRV